MAKYGIKGIDSQKMKQYNGKKSTFRLEQREKERDFKEGGESMAATIADVANLAGCSITTETSAYSVPEKVRPQTRERILQAAETLRYSPNAIARAMVHQRNHNLAFVVDPWQYPIMDAFYAEIAGAVQLEAEQRGYCVYTTASDRRELFMKKRVDGVILAGRADEGLLSDLRGQGIPAVQINDRPVSDDVPSITTDRVSGAGTPVCTVAYAGGLGDRLPFGTADRQPQGIRGRAVPSRFTVSSGVYLSGRTARRDRTAGGRSHAGAVRRADRIVLYE